MAAANFLSEFPPVRTEEWEGLIRENVAGPEYASRMIWHPEEGLAVRPYYRSEDLAGLQFLSAAPGEYPYVRGTRRTGDWRICEEIDATEPEEANRMARAAVSAGAEEIAYCGIRIESASDLALIVADLHEIPVYLKEITAEAVQLAGERLRQKPHTRGITADLDPLADLDVSAQLMAGAPEGLRPFAIRANDFHESGAGAVEELGFALAAAVDFMSEMQDRGVPLEQIMRSVGFSFSIGPELYVQIAKLRAFRMIWARVVEAFGGTRDQAKAVIHARTARWNETIYDPRVNVLRATTAAVSAILGGADSITVAPFDECYRAPDEHSSRLARNTQIILKREALLSRVADPLGGSYLIEALTNAIAVKAWKLFQELESAGGFRKAKAAGIIDSVLQERTRARDLSIGNRRIALTGTNRFPNAAEKAIDRATRLDIHHRAAEPFENLRLRTERYVKNTGHGPHILLAEIGDPKMRAARSQFAAEFLACAGFSSQRRQFERAAEIASEDADLIVLCSSDPEYLAIADELMPALPARSRRTKIVIAGNPESAEQLRALGIIGFIHMRSNAVEVLSALQQQMGIEG